MKKIFILLLFVFGYNANSQSLYIYDIDTTDFPTMRAKFWAFDEDGNQMLNLSPSDFEFIENGELRTITDISCPALPPKALSSVLTIDISGSMSSSNIDAAKEAARSWINALLNESECAITSFNEYNYLNQDFTTNRNKLLNAINNLKASGGTNFDAGLINNMAGALLVSKTGKHKKVIVLFTDGYANEPQIQNIITEAKNQNCVIYCVTLGLKCPESLKKISSETGGQYFENVTTIEQAKHVYEHILQIEQGGEPCEIEWKSGPKCKTRKTVVELIKSPNNPTSKTTYQPPISSIAKLEFEPNTVFFVNPKLGTPVTKTLKITSKNATFKVSNIITSNPAFSVSPNNFILQPNESRDLNVTYTAIDSGYIFVKFEIKNDICEQIFFAIGGYSGVSPKTPTIKLTHPNGGETFAVGSDTLITWEGISPIDTVRLDYSIDNGASWENITNKATGLKYEWKNIPKPASNQCLVRINQFPTSSTFNDNVFTLTGHNNFIYSVAFSPDGSTLASGSLDRTIKLWDMATGQLIRTLSRHSNSVQCVIFSPDGSTLASGSNDKTIKLWDVASWQEIQSLNGHTDNILSVAFSPDGNILASASLDRTIKFWDVATGQIINTLTGHNNTVWSVAFSPDGNILASGSGDNSIKLWDVVTGQEKRTLNGHTQEIRSVAFSPDGNILASASTDWTLKLWDVATGQEIHTLTGHIYPIRSITFSPDGSTLASSSSGNTIYLWDVATGQHIRTLSGHTSSILSVAFSPDGTTLASGSFDKTIKLWDVNLASLQEDVSDIVFSIVVPEATAIDIDMGKCLVSNSKDSVVNEFIQNIGTWKLDVDSIYFQGTDADAFSLVSGFPEYTIEANNSHFAEFRFTPARVGVHNAEIVIETQSDTFTQTITGEGFNPQLEIMTDIIDFGVVEVGYENTIEQIAVLKNLSNQDIEITNVVQLGPDLQQFEILEGGGNFILGANEERPMKLRFKPRFGGRTSGQIGFEYNSFASPAIAQLFGTGIGGEIEIDDYSGYPGEEIDVAFRLTNIKPEGLAELAKTFKSEVEVNGTLLFSNTGYIVNQEANFVSYEIEGNLGNSEILFNVPMKIGLGNSETSDIKLTKIELFDENGQLIDYDMEYNSGLFTLLGVCYEGGARLLDPNSVPVILSINPNPTGNTINIEFELIEKGGGELMIVDYEGKKVFSTLLKDTPGKVNLDLNSSGLPNGIYNVILQTPTINATQKLLIEK